MFSIKGCRGAWASTSLSAIYITHCLPTLIENLRFEARGNVVPGSRGPYCRASELQTRGKFTF